MKIALVTGSGGLIGSECVSFFADKFDYVIGVDNDTRAMLFGESASTSWNVDRLKEKYTNYIHFGCDIREPVEMVSIFDQFGKDIALIVHTAAQPSHDWAATNPFMDFSINATGTLNMLELTREYCPDAVFIFTSTNKVYGDTPNKIPLQETGTRFEPLRDYEGWYGIDESMSIDQSKHSVFGASKVAADIMVQEYGRYFGIKTGVFRGGCLTGPNHSGSQQHGFLSYLMKCAVEDMLYTIFGYKGKQVRDNIHSYDLVNMFWHFYNNPRPGQVYNAGGGRHSNCSVLEAISMCEDLTGRKMQIEYNENHRSGDHIWYISDISKFRSHYPGWEYTHDIHSILKEIHESFLLKAR